MNPNRKEVNLTDLHQLITNPRTDEAANDVDAVQKLYTSDNSAAKNLINLALEIADEGFDENEPIYVVEQNNGNNQYDVYEGNRRLAALSLLSNPEKYKDFLSEKHLNALKKAAKDKIPTKLEVTIVDVDEARTLMERNHGGALNGSGRISWSPEAQRRYARSKGIDNSFVGKTTASFEERFGQPIGGYIGGITTADRLFNNKKIQEYVGKFETVPDDEQLDKIKTVMDEAKQVAEEKDAAITRVFGTKKDIEEELIPRLGTNDVSEGDAQPLKFTNGSLLKYINDDTVVQNSDNYWINLNYSPETPKSPSNT